MYVLVTGGAAGIGRATTHRLLDRGHEVLVCDVDTEALDRLAEEVVTPDALTTRVVDVTDVDAVASAVSGEPLDAVVTCAATFRLGALEAEGREDIRRQFETNVFGTLDVVRAALPALRARDGRVVLLTSVLGRVSLPYHGAYAATKHALEAAGDALRVEVAPFGVDVAMVEPGPVDTGLTERAKGALDERAKGRLTGGDAADPYAAVHERVRENYDTGGTSPERVAETVVEALEADDPKARYRVGWQAWLLPLLRHLLPARVFDRITDARVQSSGPVGMLRTLVGRR